VRAASAGSVCRAPSATSPVLVGSTDGAQETDAGARSDSGSTNSAPESCRRRTVGAAGASAGRRAGFYPRLPHAPRATHPALKTRARDMYFKRQVYLTGRACRGSVSTF
jgi:hypothetical protein